MGLCLNAKTLNEDVEQVYKDLYGEDKLNAALENAADMLTSKASTFPSWS